MQRLRPAVLAASLLALAALGCGGKPDKATVEKKVKDGLAKASPEWKDVVYETRVNDTVSAVGATRAVEGQPHWFSFTGSEGNGGVAVRGPGGQWLCKYRYEKGKEVAAEKMDGGKDEDVGKFKALAGEFAAACIAAGS